MRLLKPITPVPPIKRDMDILANRPPSTRALNGETIILEYDDGDAKEMVISENLVRWRTRNLDGQDIGGEDTCDTVEMRPGVFLFDFVSSNKLLAFTHIIDRDQGRALTVWTEIIQSENGHDLRQALRPARIAGDDGPYQAVAETRELLGKRLFCEYSKEAALEHIYVNSQTLVWQWLLSPDELEPLKTEVGIESASMWKIRDKLYLLSSRDQPPIQLTLLLDLEGMKNAGRLFGIGPAGVLDRRCGAKITFLGEFKYPNGYEPG